MAARRLGQHFLVRRSLLERIASEVCPEREPLAIEIGPGRGALTEFLLPRAERVVAVEIDSRLAAHLRQRFGDAAGLEVVAADVLETDLGQWGPAAIAGNLPYYITSPILERIFALARATLLRRAIVLVQKEVAERLTAGAGGREYGFLTVHANLFTAPEILLRVPRSAFSPPPKVDSAAVRLTPRPAQAWGITEPEAFLQFAGRCFRQKRKTLRNNLVPFYPRELLDAQPEAGLRAEQVPLEGLVELHRRLDRAGRPA